MDVKYYWKMVSIAEAKARAEHGDEVFVISIEQPLLPEWRAGVVFVVSPRVAAQRLIENTHRIASEEEIRTYKQGMAARVQETRENEERRAGRRIIAANPSATEVK